MPRSGTPPPTSRRPRRADDNTTSRKPVASSNTTLFQRMGGIQAVKAVVEEFYTRLQQDEQVAEFFQAVSIAHLKRHQVEFLKIAFSHIPDTLDVNSLLLEKHKRLFQNMGLNETHFDIVAMHFVGACESHNVDASLIEEAVGIITPLRVVFEDGAKKFGTSSSPCKSPTKVKSPMRSPTRRLMAALKIGGGNKEIVRCEL